MKREYRAPLIVAGGAMLGLAAGAVAAAVASSRTSAGGNGSPVPPKPQDGTSSASRAAVRQQIWDLASMLADELNWPGLPHFMIAQAWAESRFKPTAMNPEGGPNAARGVFQIRPKSAMKGNSAIVDNPNRLYDVPTSVALNASYLERLRKYGPTSEIDWLALRRGTAFPSHVDDFSEEKQRSRDVRGRLEKAFRAIGLPLDFMRVKAFPKGFHWPGIDKVLAMVGGSVYEPFVSTGSPEILPPLLSGEGGLSFEELEIDA